MSKKKINIFLVDDHKMFLEGIALILNEIENIEIIGTANNGQEALKKINILIPDVLITDIDMPIIDGIELTKKIKNIYPSIKVIAVSSHQNAIVISNAIKAGINGYILKNTGKFELCIAIEHVYQGNNYFNEEIKRIVNNSIFNSKESKDNKVQLSDREKEILILISNEKSSQEIATILHLSINTIETHRKNLMRKIGTKNMIGLVKYAIQQGYV